MTGIIPLTMVILGAALMSVNVYRYFRFSGHVRLRGDWERERRLFHLPVVLLVLFLAGYLAVAVFGQPDLIIGGILLGGSVFVFVMLVIMERTVDRIQENERLEAQLAAEQAAGKAKTFFLSNMSHDIRTPLNAIIGYTALARKEGAKPEMLSEYIGKIDIAGRQLLDIVNDVLEMSRIESGKVSLDPEPMDLAVCVSDVEDLVRTQLETRNLQFDVSCDITDRWVMCDRNQLNRALMNLLCNAGKFTPEGGYVSLNVKQTGGTTNEGEYEFRVKDTGIGMSDEFVEHLFTPFEREKTSTVSKTQGTGLGMAITHSIIEMMGGEISVKTRQGEGTEFTVRLKLAKSERPSEKEASGQADFSGRRLLLVEDNPTNQEIASMILTESGFQVDTAENGEIALEILGDSEPGTYDLVLMDIQMPVMDGYTAAGIIRGMERQDLARIPILAMTANAFREDIQAAEQAGMNGHIAKPLEIDTMLETIRAVLET